MPHKPPINLRELGKAGVLNEKKFFKKLSEKCNYVDEATVKSFYMGLVKTITSELRENGVVRLPHLGDFALVKQKDRKGLAGKTQTIIRGGYRLKFYVKRELNEYFKKLAEFGGKKLDPREKVLGNKSIGE
jgi:nucleoid DNA-binding protein